MKPLSDPLKALLATRQFYKVKLFTFTLFDGTVLRHCAADRDVVWDGDTYSCGGQTGPYFERDGNRAKASWKIGVDVTQVTFDVMPGTGLVLGLPWLLAAQYGLFDGGEVAYDTAYAPNGSTAITGILPFFVGRVGDVSWGRSLITFVINSHMELLSQNTPGNLFQSGCNNALYDPNCTLDREDFAVAGVAGAGSGVSFLLTNLPQPADYFALGDVVFTTGINAGIARSVRSWTPGQNGVLGTLKLTAPFPSAPIAGDTFTVYPGCDLKQTTCAAKFNNIQNFRGTPYVPDPSTAL